MSETTNPLNDFLNMQEETPTMFGGFAFPPVTPDAVPQAPAQIPSVPAQPVPQAVPQEAPVAYAVTPPAPQSVPQQVPQQPASPAAAPTQGSLFQAAMAQTPAGQQPVISTDDVIKALKAQVEQQQTRINELEQQSGKQQLTINNHEYFLERKGLTAEFEAPAHAQEHTHHHHP